MAQEFSLIFNQKSNIACVHFPYYYALIKRIITMKSYLTDWKLNILEDLIQEKEMSLLMYLCCFYQIVLFPLWYLAFIFYVQIMNKYHHHHHHHHHHQDVSITRVPLIVSLVIRHYRSPLLAIQLERIQCPHTSDECNNRIYFLDSQQRCVHKS